MSAALQVKVKEKPMWFSGPMIRAILEGRKTQTRRVITDERIKVFAPGYADDRERIIGLCPYGKAGDKFEVGWHSERSHITLEITNIRVERGYSWESNPWVWVIEFRKL